MDNNILHCMDCNKVFKNTNCDSVPVFIFDKEINDFVTVQKNDLEDFERGHKGHRLQKLTELKETSYTKMSFGDKRELGYFNATDGKKILLIKKWRGSINEPLHYKIIKDGYLKIANVKAIPHTDLIRAQLVGQFSWMKQTTVDKFVEIVKNTVLKMDLKTIEECFWDTGDSMVVLAKIGFREVREIIRECQKFLSWSELMAVRDFIEENNCDNGVMTVRVQKKMWIKKINLRRIKNRKHLVHG